MPAELKFVKGRNGAWFPADMYTVGWADRQKMHTVITGKFTRGRDLVRHRKFFALLKLGFQYWEPQAVVDETTGEYFIPEASPEMFREFVTIRAGYFEQFYYPDGSLQVRAKSIAFDNMEEDEFRKLYHNAVNVIMQLPVAEDMTYDQFHNAVTEIAKFDETP